jgi:hypothetical protein
VLVERLAQLAIQTHRDGDILLVHDPHIFLQQFRRMPMANARMHMDIDHGKSGLRELVLGHDEHRRGPELVERQRSAVAAVKRTTNQGHIGVGRCRFRRGFFIEWRQGAIGVRVRRYRGRAAAHNDRQLNQSGQEKGGAHQSPLLRLGKAGVEQILVTRLQRPHIVA